jgi:hypothetical protein
MQRITVVAPRRDAPKRVVTCTRFCGGGATGWQAATRLQQSLCGSERLVEPRFATICRVFVNDSALGSFIDCRN